MKKMVQMKKLSNEKMVQMKNGSNEKMVQMKKVYSKASLWAENCPNFLTGTLWSLVTSPDFGPEKLPRGKFFSPKKISLAVKIMWIIYFIFHGCNYLKENANTKNNLNLLEVIYPFHLRHLLTAA
jgi:hypothetical protein